MIPLGDAIPSRTAPLVTVAVIVLHLLLFLYDLARGLAGPAVMPVLDLLCVWLFGPTLEDRLGHRRFLIAYVLSGMAAAMLDSALYPGAILPVVSRTGAAAGVMAAYFALYPRSRTLVVAPVPALPIVDVPAAFFPMLWMLVLLLSGAVSPGIAAGAAAGVAGMFAFRRPERLRVEWWHDRP